MWCGVVWCGLGRCDVVWGDAMWCDAVWCVVVWCGLGRCDVVRCDVVRCGVWCVVVWCPRVSPEPLHVMSCPVEACGLVPSLTDEPTVHGKCLTPPSTTWFCDLALPRLTQCSAVRSADLAS